MKVIITLNERELKDAVLCWLDQNSEAVQAGNFEHAIVDIVREPPTGEYTAVVQPAETFDCTEVTK